VNGAWTGKLCGTDKIITQYSNNNNTSHYTQKLQFVEKEKHRPIQSVLLKVALHDDK